MEQWTDDFGVQFEKDDNGVVSLIDAPHDIKEYSVPDFVTKIGDYAFFECFELTSISIPDSVVEIGNCAFGECFELTHVSISLSNLIFGAWPFSGCYKLTNITILESIPQSTTLEEHSDKDVYIDPFTDPAAIDPDSPF